jgi:hypothetical protein
MVIFLTCHYAFSTDTFHPGKERIYRTVEVVTQDGNTIKLASAPLDFARTARGSLTGLETVANIASLLTRDFLLLISLSLVIASPIAWMITHRWLQDFLYRAPVSSWIFVFSGGLALALGLLTMGFQAIRAATANPVKSLRAE